MKLFEMKNWNLHVTEEAWGLQPFKKILDRDKTKNKDKAMAEILFVWFFSDIKSDYMSMSEKDRVVELTKDINGLDDKWKPDKAVWDAIEFYKKQETIIQKLYRQTSSSASDIGDYLANTKELLLERDNSGKPVTDINKITQSIQRVPKIMADLKAAYQEVVKEQEDMSNKKKGSRAFNLFEDGLK